MPKSNRGFFYAVVICIIADFSIILVFGIKDPKLQIIVMILSPFVYVGSLFFFAIVPKYLLKKYNLFIMSHKKLFEENKE